MATILAYTSPAIGHLFPIGRDQFEVARRVEVSNSGTRLPAKKLNPAALRKAVSQAMTMSAGAKRVAAGFVATGGAAAGADAIESRLLRSSMTARATFRLAFQPEEQSDGQNEARNLVHGDHPGIGGL